MPGCSSTVYVRTINIDSILFIVLRVGSYSSTISTRVPRYQYLSTLGSLIFRALNYNNIIIIGETKAQI